MDESRDLGIVSSHEDGEANVEADFIQDRETLIVEKEIPPVPLCKGSHAEGNGLPDSLECLSTTDAFRPSETVMLSKSSDLEIHNDGISISNFRRRSVKKNASESRNGTVEDRLDMMKSSLSEEKQRDLRDSDFLFDADFEAFLA
ncbi:hypothetical protein KP509_02G082900 [Ceratopteris richardii]|nr:hypothetical protein KP509_02G082900 [Ceratopteris richardii]